jgi:hypothetical protein
MRSYPSYHLAHIGYNPFLVLITERGGFEPPETGTQSQQISSLLSGFPEALHINHFTGSAC